MLLQKAVSSWRSKPVLEVIDAAADMLVRSMPIGTEIVGVKRVDRPAYPVAALREAVVNAVAHRDDSTCGEAIRIFVYTDRIEIHSLGVLPPGITLDDLRSLRTVSLPHNPVLAQFLRDVPGSRERIGARIRLMVNEMRLRGLPDPECVEQHECVVILRNGRMGTPSDASPLHARQRLGLRMIQERGSSSSRDYMDATGVLDRTALRALRAMVDQGIIVVRGRTRSARYYLP